MSNILKPRLQYKPFDYPEAFSYYQSMQSMHWLTSEIPMSGDVIDWNTKINPVEKNVIASILKGFTQTEVIVADYWSNKVSKWFKVPEIQMCARVMAASEVEHQVAYDSLNTSLGLEDYEAFLYEPATKARLDRIMFTKEKTPEDIALSLALFSAFSEGVSLFSSFAVLMSFSRRNLLKGVGQIVAYSSLDECLVPDTEVLTTKGWMKIDQVKDSDKVAQFNLKDNSISFTHPTKVIESYADEMISFSSNKGGFNQIVTPNHRMVIQAYGRKEWSFVEAKDCSFHCYNRAPLSGFLQENGRRLSCLERFFIATQADGSISERYTGARTGFRPINFSFSKERKISRFESILAELGFTFTKVFTKGRGNKKPMSLYRVNVPANIVNTIDLKRFDWVILDQINSTWAEEFLEEVKNWDGHVPKDQPLSIYYSSVVKENVVLLQTLSALCGRNGVVSVSEDKRSDSFSDVYRIYITRKSTKNGSSINKQAVPYSGKVYCLTVPTGAFLVKYKDTVSVTGNCAHSNFGCWLFNKVIEENPNLFTQEFKKKVYEAARLTVELEDKFIDMVFSKGEIEGIDSSDLKQYIRHRCNVKLIEIGLKNNWKNLDKNKVENVSVPFEMMLAGISSQDFFSQKEISYKKGQNFDKMWEV